METKETITALTQDQILKRLESLEKLEQTLEPWFDKDHVGTLYDELWTEIKNRVKKVWDSELDFTNTITIRDEYKDHFSRLYIDSKGEIVELPCKMKGEDLICSRPWKVKPFISDGSFSILMVSDSPVFAIKKNDASDLGWNYYGLEICLHCLTPLVTGSVETGPHVRTSLVEQI